MPQYQMPLLILCMLLISCSSNIVNAEVAAQTVDLFKPGETNATVEGAEYPPGGRDSLFKTYSLIDLNGNMAALAFGVYSGSSNRQSYDFWARSSNYENKKISGVIGGRWDTQVVVKKSDDPDSGTVLYGPKAVVKDGKIFSLLTRVSWKTSINKEIELFVGEVKGTGSITWKTPKSLKKFLDEEAKKNSWDQFDVSLGRGAVMGGKTIVFPFVARNTNKTKEICTVIFSEDDGDTWSFPSSPVISEDCQTPSLLEWEGSLLMVSSNNPPQKLYESKDMGKTWTEARGKLSHLLLDRVNLPALSNIQDRVTATIEGKNVILSTRFAGDVNRKELQLWFADSSRIHYAGQITADTGDEHSLSTLLYAQDELFAMYNKGGEASSTVVLAHLSNQLDQIKSVLKTWNDVKKGISPSSLTNGLVGFLSNKSDTTTWEDEYLGVGATVQGSATKVDGGLKLTLPGAQVEWPIGEQGDNQAYAFTDRGFSLVAMVTIHNKPQSVILLMGVVLFDLNLDGGYTGLSYDKDKQWKGVTVDGGSGQPNTWEEGETYQVALVFKDGTGSAYIDGKRLGSLEDPVGGAALNANDAQDFHSERSGPLPPQSSQGRAGRSLPLRVILQIFIGEEQGCNQKKEGNQEKEDSQVTIRNVMLYTRPLSPLELRMLTINIKGDNSMYEHVSRLLLVLMGLLGFVTLC